MDCFNGSCKDIHVSGKMCDAWEPSSQCKDRMSHPPKPQKVEADVWIDSWNKTKKKNVTVYYWYKDWSDRTGYINGASYPYEERHEMIDHIMACGLKVMVLHQDNGITIAIDDKPFYTR